MLWTLKQFIPFLLLTRKRNIFIATKIRAIYRKSWKRQYFDILFEPLISIFSVLAGSEKCINTQIQSISCKIARKKQTQSTQNYLQKNVESPENAYNTLITCFFIILCSFSRQLFFFFALISGSSLQRKHY